MESANDIQWFGDSEQRFIEKAVGLGQWGKDNGHPHLGTRLIEEVFEAINTISQNVNMYEVRDADERVVPLHKSGYILVYTKEYFVGKDGQKQVRLLILDIRRSY